jgi:hypothetical protein
MTNHSYVDPAKQLSRDKLRGFIKTHILSIKPAKDVYVLCFPGAEKDGEEGIEIKEVYDPLGIPRSNIVGLECGKEQYARLQRANLGIRTDPRKDIDFFCEIGGKFDIISLDYTGQKNDGVIDTLNQITYQRCLNAIGVLAINNMAGRENSALQLMLKARSAAYKGLVEQVETTEGKGDFAAIEGARILAGLDVLHGNADPNLGKSRDDFSFTIIDILSMGRRALGEIDPTANLWKIDPFIFAYPGYEQTEETMSKTLSGILDNPKAVRELKYLAHRENMIQHMGREIYIFLKENGLNFTGVSKDFETQLRTAVACATSIYGASMDCYQVGELERYAYVSNTGHKMEMDLLATKTTDRLWRRVNDKFSFSQGRFEIRRTDFTTQRRAEKFLEQILTIERITRKSGELVMDMPERQFLGSSVKGKKSGKGKEKLTKKDAVSLLKEGIPISEIRDAYSGWSKARLTKLAGDIPTTEQVEEMLQSGDSVEEISQTFTGWPLEEILNLSP